MDNGYPIFALIETSVSTIVALILCLILLLLLYIFLSLIHAQRKSALRIFFIVIAMIIVGGEFSLVDSPFTVFTSFFNLQERW